MVAPEFVEPRIKIPRATFDRFSKLCETFGKDFEAEAAFALDIYVRTAADSDWETHTTDPEYTRVLNEAITGNPGGDFDVLAGYHAKRAALHPLDGLEKLTE